jgi:hypothetical protein
VEGEKTIFIAERMVGKIPVPSPCSDGEGLGVRHCFGEGLGGEAIKAGRDLGEEKLFALFHQNRFPYTCIFHLICHRCKICQCEQTKFY